MRQYYIIYNEKAKKINYTFLFCLYKIAQINKKEKLYNCLKFNSYKELAEEIKEKTGKTFSISTIGRQLKEEEYKEYFSITKEKEYNIILNNNFKENNGRKYNKFIVLNEKQIDFMIQQDNKLLNKYFLYLLFYCGYNNNKTDSTQAQILTAIDYNEKSNNNKQYLSNINSLLIDNNLLKIISFTDEKGHKRNIYSIIS